ncbi:MAG: BMP family ABC transporter substrate-binding protein, partial [Haliea sp.]
LRPFAAGRRGVHDNAGREVIASGAALSDEQIMKMNWLVEGVQAPMPR